MKWNDHKGLEGKHAILGASTWRWINWDDTQLNKNIVSSYASTIGTLIHDLAKDCIRNKIQITDYDINLIVLKLSQNRIPHNMYDPMILLNKIKSYVNDCIANNMSSEVLLFYSRWCFGTADAINYDEKLKLLQIYDLKTGSIPAHMEQLYIYDALFCLEYDIKPKDIVIENRIYQNDSVICVNPIPSTIKNIQTLIKERTKYLNEYLN